MMARKKHDDSFSPEALRKDAEAKKTKLLGELVSLCAEAEINQRKSAYHLRQKNEVVAKTKPMVNDLWLTRLTIEVVRDGYDRPFIIRTDPCDTRDLDTSVPLIKCQLRSGSKIRGIISDLKALNNSTICLGLWSARGPRSISVIDGYSCLIPLRFIESINGIQFDLGAWR